MAQPEPTFDVSGLWTCLREIRGQGIEHRPVESVIAPLAALLLLRWAEHLDTEQEAVAAFDGHDYVPALSRDQHWSAWCGLRGKGLVGALLREILPALRRAPTGSPGQSLRRLATVVENLTRESPEVVETLVQWVQFFDLGTAGDKQAAGDTLAAFFDRATETSPKLGGEFTTPRPVIEVMVDLLAPSPGERIYDPCFGTGGLLAAAACRLQEKAKQMPPKVWTEVQHRSVFGLEINPFAYSIGLARVVLAGIDQPGLELGNVLERPLVKDRTSDGFDCIFAVPPWGGRVREEVAAQFPVSSTNIETLFLQHVMASLRPGGRAVIALPEGVLFRTGADRMVRKELLSDFRVEGVVSLPAGAFHPYTGIKTSLVLFRRDEGGHAVRFLQVDEWPSVRPGETRSRDKVVAAARSIAGEFKNGTPNGRLWESSIKKLATRDWELVAKRTGEEALSRSLGALQEADDEVPVRPLMEVADVFAGVSYGKSVTTPSAEDPAAFAGLVRVADVKGAAPQDPSLFLTADGSDRVQPKHWLRTGDILLTTSGTIGKLGVVSRSTGTLGAVAAKSMAVIRPGEQIYSQFLRSLLASGVYQEWFRGHARGATIQHLSIRTLAHLPIPVPKVPVQERVVQQVGLERHGALAVLAHIVTGDSEDPVLKWLETSSDIHKLRRLRDTDDPFVLLERIAHYARNLRNQAAHAQVHNSSDLLYWLLEFAEAMRPLGGLKHVPRGAGRMAILDGAQLRLGQISAVLEKSSSPVLEAALEVTKGISRILRIELGSLMEDVKLVVGVEPSAVVAGTENEIQVRVKNEAPLALRDFSALLARDVAWTHPEYLAEGATLSFSVKIPAVTKTGPFPFTLRWRADRLDGQPVSGELALAVDVRSTREAVRLAELGTSPYIVGGPIDREEMFFGRRDLLDKVRRQLSTSHRANVILLEGNRRSGKTSILKRLQTPGVLQGWIVVNCSFQGGEGHESKPGLPTNEVFRLMARDIGWAVHDAGVQVPLPDMVLPDSEKRFKVMFARALPSAFSGRQPFELFELYVQAVLEAASPRRLLLMLDEFDKLQEGIDAGITSPQVPENIRYLLHTYPGLSAILTGSRRLKRLREEYWSALFGFGHRVPVGDLTLEDARLLVTQPVEGRLTYVPQATDRVVELCSRQPFLIQSLCNRIFETAAFSDERTVTVGAVDAAAKEMVQDNEHFRTLWDYAGTERKRLLLSLCQLLKDEPDPITLSLLETKLEENSIALSQRDRLGDDLEYLRELELVELEETTRGSAYALAVPLMADWIRRNIDFEDQRQKTVRESEEMVTSEEEQ